MEGTVLFFFDIRACWGKKKDLHVLVIRGTFVPSTLEGNSWKYNYLAVAHSFIYFC